MKIKPLLGLLLAFYSATSSADPYGTGRSYSPYPPGCVTLPLRQVDLYGDNVVRFWTGVLELEIVHKVGSHDMYNNFRPIETSLYRVGCAEPGRSVILVEFRLPQEWSEPRDSRLVLPTFGGVTGFHSVPFILKSEPNAWGQSLQQHLLTKQSFGDYTNGWYDARNFTWLYVLDIAPVGEFWGDTTEYYNGSFGLEVYRAGGAYSGTALAVPATSDVLEPNRVMPLNGRLTGTWVEEGAADQGFLLSFSNPVPPAGSEVEGAENSKLNVFFSWFTFDSQGRQLWLAGDARFPQGATEVTIPIIQVKNGQFLGPRPETGPGINSRVTVGEVRLKARSCNMLDAEYDLTGIDLGTGELHLQRLHALETASYPCRDYKARLADITPLNSN